MSKKRFGKPSKWLIVATAFSVVALWSGTALAEGESPPPGTAPPPPGQLPPCPPGTTPPAQPCMPGGNQPPQQQPGQQPPQCGPSFNSTSHDGQSGPPNQCQPPTGNQPGPGCGPNTPAPRSWPFQGPGNGSPNPGCQTPQPPPCAGPMPDGGNEPNKRPMGAQREEGGPPTCGGDGRHGDPGHGEPGPPPCQGGPGGPPPEGKKSSAEGPGAGPGGPQDGGCPQFKRGFKNRIWTMKIEPVAMTDDGYLIATLTEFLRLPKKFQDQDDELVDQDVHIKFLSKAKLVDKNGDRIKAADLADAETAVIKAKMVRETKWHTDEEDDEAVPTFVGRTGKVTS